MRSRLWTQYQNWIIDFWFTILVIVLIVIAFGLGGKKEKTKEEQILRDYKNTLGPENDLAQKPTQIRHR